MKTLSLIPLLSCALVEFMSPSVHAIQPSPSKSPSSTRA